MIKLTHFGPKARRGSDFYSILVLLVLAKKVGEIGAVIRTCFDILSYVSFGATRCLSMGLSVHVSVCSSVHHTLLKICKLCFSVVSPTFTWHFYISLLNITKYSSYAVPCDKFITFYITLAFKARSALSTECILYICTFHLHKVSQIFPTTYHISCSLSFFHTR